MAWEGAGRPRSAKAARSTPRRNSRSVFCKRSDHPTRQCAGGRLFSASSACGQPSPGRARCRRRPGDHRPGAGLVVGTDRYGAGAGAGITGELADLSLAGPVLSQWVLFRKMAFCMSTCRPDMHLIDTLTGGVVEFSERPSGHGPPDTVRRKAEMLRGNARRMASRLLACKPRRPIGPGTELPFRFDADRAGWQCPRLALAERQRTPANAGSTGFRWALRGGRSNACGCPEQTTPPG